MRSLILASLLSLAFVATGCAADGTDSPENESASAESAYTKTVGYGKSCGGNLANAAKCKTGLACSHVDAHGNFINPDLPGVCLEDVGGTCGGNMVGAKACAGGLTCVSSNPDVAGTCQKLAQYGESCGGFTAHPVQCASGLACSHVDANGNVINPDLPGVCLEGAGSACGGNMVGAKVCAGGLTCESSNPDVPGICG